MYNLVKKMTLSCMNNLNVILYAIAEFVTIWYTLINESYIRNLKRNQ